MSLSTLQTKKNFIPLLFHVLVLMLGVLSFTSCSSSKTIVNGLDEKEANEIIVFLAGRNIDAAKVQSLESGGTGGAKIVLWDIVVNAEQSTEAMSLLNQAGLPRRRGQNLLGIFSGGGLVPSELQEKIRYQTGLGEQIASTIRKIDGVLDAEVQISFPEEDPLNPNAKKQKITASVYVKHNGVLDDPNSHLVTKIKRLVAASVPNLDYDNVTVIGDRVRPTSLNEGFSSSSEEAKQYLSVWTIILAKESVTGFRIIFFSFVVAILLLLLSLIWLLWKMYPLLKKYGGVKELFHIHPIQLEDQEIKAEEKTPEELEKAAKEKQDEEDVDKNIDVT